MLIIAQLTMENAKTQKRHARHQHTQKQIEHIAQGMHRSQQTVLGDYKWLQQ